MCDRVLPNVFLGGLRLWGFVRKGDLRKSDHRSVLWPSVGKCDLAAVAECVSAPAASVTLPDFTCDLLLPGHTS